jgi:hypothetical protein
MSLTSFLNEPDVRERFRQEFSKPRSIICKNIIAPPLTKRYTLVGTAFDYLLRFNIQYHNPIAVQTPWMAYFGIENLQCQSSLYSYDITSSRLEFKEDPLHAIARKKLQQAELHYKKYLSCGRMTRGLIKSAIFLAQLDVIYRSGYVDDNLGIAYEEDVEDLCHLLSLVDPQHFNAKKICLLNPTFGDASFLMGGADGDLLIDDILFDFKVTNMLRVKRSHFNQLIGYFILHWLHSIGGIKPKPPIRKIGIYFARFAHLEIYHLQELINQKTFPDFVSWFVERAEKQYPRHYDKYLEHKWNSIAAAKDFL